ncbi:MAG: ATP-binding protein [Flavobacteriia bacterium]|nr:ATP-binding protein [Flavobacteriia bacterium]
MQIFEHSERQINFASEAFKRYLFFDIDWRNRLIGVKGARGTGKTTLLLQWLKSQKISSKLGVYLSLDDLYFSTNSLSKTIDTFYKNGGKILVLDEVHKYKDWSKVIKNAYDFYPDLKIVFTGSSIIDITKQEGDLSRRAVIYELSGLSYREYLELKYKIKYPTITFDEILFSSKKYMEQLPINFRPLSFFKEYLEFGYYPFVIENQESFYQKINQLVRTIIEYDMAEIQGFDIRSAKKMLQLISVIAQQVPFKPNISSLALKTGIHRNSIINYLYYLEQAKLITLLCSSGNSISILQKPDKIFLNNTSLLYALSNEKANIGTIRETFFISQFRTKNEITLPLNGDFKIDIYTFEVGGKNKTNKQISNLPNSYVVKDDIENAHLNHLPLWLFGMMY